MDENVERLIRSAFERSFGRAEWTQVTLAVGSAIATWELARQRGLPRGLAQEMALRVLEWHLWKENDGDVGAP